MLTEIWCGNLEDRDHLEDIGVHGRVILKRIKEMDWLGVDWINLSEDRDKCRAVVYTVMNLRAS
jgi:hypothetical protein